VYTLAMLATSSKTILFTAVLYRFLVSFTSVLCKFGECLVNMYLVTESFVLLATPLVCKPVSSILEVHPPVSRASFLLA